MTLADALSSLLTKLALDPKIPILDAHDVCSAGIRKKNGEVPALYLNEDDAVEAWLPAVLKAAEGKTRFRFVDQPALRKYHITMMPDKDKTHRVADFRFTVESRIVFAK